jgi:hypothetical protein
MMSRPPTPDAVLDRAPFSLFNGDLLNRRFNQIGLQSRKALDIAGRSALLVVITWIPMAALALVQGLYSTTIEARNFFADYAAYGQFLIAVPLFVVAERVVNRHTREAARDFVTSGVVGPVDREKVTGVHRRIRELRLWMTPEWIAIGLAYTLSFLTIGPEFFGAGGLETWHTGAGDAEHRIYTLPGGLTLAGAWAMFVALPALNYIWLRLAWKIVIWTYYLYRMSRFRLHLVASHPDLTGGIGFVSDVQARWAIVIFAYGISNVAAVIAYKVGIEKASLAVMPVWAPAVLFVLIAPSLFTLPLLMFTKQLFRAKRRALSAYREHARRHAVEFEARWFSARTLERAHFTDVMDLNNLATVFNRMQQMRVVPFDLRSFGQLMASTLGSIATALPILRLEGTLEDWLNLLARFFGR